MSVRKKKWVMSAPYLLKKAQHCAGCFVYNMRRMNECSSRHSLSKSYLVKAQKLAKQTYLHFAAANTVRRKKSQRRYTRDDVLTASHTRNWGPILARSMDVINKARPANAPWFTNDEIAVQAALEKITKEHNS